MKIAVMMSGKPDAILRGCFDCHYCQASLSWWCINIKAIEERGTTFPDIVKCKHWEPVIHVSSLSWWQRFLGDYIKIKGAK